MKYSLYFVAILLSFSLLLALVYAQSTETSRDICRQYFDLSPEKAKASSTLKGYPATNAIDQDLKTNWFGSPEEPFPKWIQFDLGSNRCVNSADLAFFFRDSPSSFKLEISDDGKFWNNLSDEVKLEEGQDLAKISFFPKIGRYVRFLQTSSKREYGSLREISLSSSALRSADNKKISLLIVNEEGDKGLGEVTINIKENSKIIESRKTDSKGRVSFQDLASKKHTVEILCPINKSSSNNIIFSTVLSSIKSYLPLVKNTGYVSYRINSGYGEICSGENFLDNFLCKDKKVEEPKFDEPKVDEPKKEEPKFDESVFDNPLIFCGDYALGYPKKAKASSTLKGYPATNAIDQDLKTNWFGSPEEPFPKWIQFDLGEKQCINGAELSINELDVPINIHLQVSNDGKNWNSVSSEFSVSDDFPYYISFNEVQARYVKVLETSSERIFGSLADIKINKAKMASTATIIENSGVILEKQINPEIILSIKDLSSSLGLSGLEAVVFNNETDSYGRKETDSEGKIVFVNALSQDTNIRVYCAT
jgi:hypothetical protein